MSTDDDKFKHSKRLQKNENAVKKQVKIAKQHGLGFNDEVIKEPHRLEKHHSMDCGKPGCTLCGNPRRNNWNKKDKLTAQEKRLFQDVEKTTDRHSNGLTTEEE
jgi:hypothetical protein